MPGNPVLCAPPFGQILQCCRALFNFPRRVFGESHWVAGDAGLGLAIAKTCVEGLGGRIRASNWEGGGLVVKLERDAELKCSEG